MTDNDTDSTQPALQAAFLRHEDSLAPDTRMVGENDSTVYRTLLESTQAIPWKIDWAAMEFAYIGPQIEALIRPVIVQLDGDSPPFALLGNWVPEGNAVTVAGIALAAMVI